MRGCKKAIPFYDIAPRDPPPLQLLKVLEFTTDLFYSILSSTFNSYLFLFSYSFKDCNFVFKVTFVFNLLLFFTLSLYV